MNNQSAYNLIIKNMTIKINVNLTLVKVLSKIDDFEKIKLSQWTLYETPTFNMQQKHKTQCALVTCKFYFSIF